MALRITNGNCSPPCSGGFTPPHFVSPDLAVQALIRAGKTSVT